MPAVAAIRVTCTVASAHKPLQQNVLTWMIFMFQGSRVTRPSKSASLTKITHTRHWKNSRLVVELKSKELKAALLRSTMLAEATQYAAPDTRCTGRPRTRRESAAATGFASFPSRGPFSMSLSSATAMADQRRIVQAKFELPVQMDDQITASSEMLTKHRQAHGCIHQHAPR